MNYKYIAEIIKLHDEISLENKIVKLKVYQQNLTDATEENYPNKIKRTVVHYYCNKKKQVKRKCRIYRTKTYTRER